LQKHLIHSAHFLLWSEQTLSQEKILETLQEIGLTKLEAKIYILIQKKGPLKARDIVKRLKITKQQLYPTIKKLKGRGIVSSSLEHPARFFAIEFDKALDLFSKAKIEEAKTLQINKNLLFNDWKSISVKEVSDSTSKFTVIQGRKYIYSKIQQMIQETNNKFSLILNLSELIRIEQSGVLDSIEMNPLKSTIQFRIITEIPQNQQHIIKKLLKNFNPKIQVKSQIGFRLSLFPKMVIKSSISSRQKN
jgi:sugar-specific transcriptional regulator TrmB